MSEHTQTTLAEVAQDDDEFDPFADCDRKDHKMINPAPSLEVADRIWNTGKHWERA